MNLTRNEVKISFGKQEYKVNEKKGTVRCRLFFEVKYPEDELGRISYRRPSTKCICATAYCSPDDTFNEEIGKKVAQAKAESEAYFLVADLLYKGTTLNTDWRSSGIVGSVADDIIMKFAQKASRCIQHNTDYIYRLTSPKE